MESTKKRKCTLPPPVTISNFDDSDQSSSSSETFEAQRLLRRIPSEMCMVSLLEELCACYAKDSREQRILFKNLSGYLSKAKMIPVTTTQDEFQQVRTNYRIAIRNFLYTALAASHADPEERYLSVPATGVTEQIRKAFLRNRSPVFFPSFLNPNFQKQSPQVTSRYKKDFVELKRIGKGGFGSVYKVRSILDNQEYAIKKIKLKGTDKEFYEKVIREVILLARMQHPNIVRYNTAWIDHQPSQSTPRNCLPAIEFNRQESSSSDDVDNEDCCKPISSDFVLASCSIKEITDEIIEEDLEFHRDPTIEEEIDESDVEFKFESDTYESEMHIHSNTKISSRQSTTVLNSENFQLTSDEQMETYEFTDVTTSATEEYFSSKQTESIHLCGRFSSYNVLRSNNGSYSEHIESQMDLTDGASNGNLAFKKTDNFHSLSSTACLGTRKEERERKHEDHDNPSEFENSKVILYIQMELCSRTLCDWLEERNDRDPATGCDVFSIVDESVNQAVFKQMAEGISYIHSKNFLHRDLKPKNIFLAGPEKALHICIGDFGLAREQEQRGAMTPTATLDRQLREVVMIPDDKLTTDIGTSTYASPEQLCDTMYDHKSDMYSLGIICYELYHPFKSQMERSKCLTALRKGNVADEIQTRWPHEFTVIEQLTSKEPHRRPSAEELKDKLSMSKDEVIKSLKKELIERNQQLKEKDDVIENLRLELSRMRSLKQN